MTQSATQKIRFETYVVQEKLTRLTEDEALTMLETIAATPGSRAGFKVSGGVRTVADAALYAGLVREILGPAALNPKRFRIGASGLLNDIEAVLGGGAAPAPGSGY